MDSLRETLERVSEAAEYFVRTPSVRLLYVATDDALRIAVLEHLCALEMLDANRAPFFVLEAPTEPHDDGWALRFEELRADWQTLHESAPDQVAPLWPEAAGKTPLVRFALELKSALSQARGPMDGLVVVFAPVWVRDERRWLSDLRALIEQTELSAVRFVVVESESTYAEAWAKKLGASAEIVDARVDHDAVRREAKESLEAQKNAPPGAGGQLLSGAAGPPVPPPPRKGEAPPVPPEERAALAADAGVSPALFDVGFMHELKVLLLSAASFMAEGESLSAIETQRQVVDRCREAGLSREAVVHTLILGGYVLQSGHVDRALGVYREARATAEAEGFVDLAVQAELAVGSSQLAQSKWLEAAASYAEAGRLGAHGGAPILAVEAYRMSGQLLASKKRTEEAMKAFARAIEIANDGGDEIRRASSASQAARALAELCRKHRLHAQADSLEAQAAAMEALATEPATDSNARPSVTSVDPAEMPS